MRRKSNTLFKASPIFAENTEKVYGLIWGQYSAALQALIKGVSGYNENAVSFDTIWLLKELKKVTTGIDSKANT